MIGARAPVRGLEKALESSALLITAAWPEIDASWRDEKVENDFLLLQDVIRAIRDLRSQYQVPPSKKLKAVIEAPTALTSQLDSASSLVCDRAGLQSIAYNLDTSTQLTAVTVAGEMKIHLLDVLDPEKERARLTSQKQKLLKDLARSEKKLGNPRFVDKAPAHIVEKEKARVSATRNQLELLEKSLEAIAPQQ